MNKKILALALAAVIFIMLSGCSGSDKDNKGNLPNSQTPTESNSTGTSGTAGDKDYNKIGLDLKEKELLSVLKNSIKAADAVKLLGEPEEKSEAIVWEADGLEHESWYYTSKGTDLDIVKSKEKQQSVFSVFIYSPSTLKTSKGIGIGSTREEVLKAYDREINPKELSPDSMDIIAGSLDGGIIFSFEDNKVSSIFIGVAAE